MNYVQLLLLLVVATKESTTHGPKYSLTTFSLSSCRSLQLHEGLMEDPQLRCCDVGAAAQASPFSGPEPSREGADGNGIHGDGGVRTQKPSAKDQRWTRSVRGRLRPGTNTTRTVTSPSTKLLVAQSAIFECLWCAQTLAQCLRMLSRRFFASKHARQRRATAAATMYCCRHERERVAIPTRSQPQMRGLPHVAENFGIEMFAARPRDCLQPHCCQPPLADTSRACPLPTHLLRSPSNVTPGTRRQRRQTFR